MKTLAIEHMLQLHVLVIDHDGGASGLRDISRLESAIASQTQEVFGKELYETIHDKAAAMGRTTIGDHPFVDGNKRTAMLVMTTFLEINGLKFSAEKGEIEDYAVAIATEKLDVAAIAAWLRQNTR